MAEKYSYEDGLELAKGLMSATLHGPIPTETTMRIASALMGADKRLLAVTRERDEANAAADNFLGRLEELEGSDDGG